MLVLGSILPLHIKNTVLAQAFTCRILTEQNGITHVCSVLVQAGLARFLDPVLVGDGWVMCWLVSCRLLCCSPSLLAIIAQVPPAVVGSNVGVVPGLGAVSLQGAVYRWTVLRCGAVAATGPVVVVGRTVVLLLR